MMMMMMKFVMLLLLLVMCGGGRGDFVSDEEHLRQMLLTNYSKQVRPQFKTHVTVSAFLMSLNHLDISSQSVSVNLLLSVFWNDSRLMWNATEQGGLTSVVVAPEDVWTPPLVVENSVDNVGVIGGKSRDATPIRVFFMGRVQWLPPMEVTVSCEMLIAHYPFDTQPCSIIITGWTYPISEMELEIGPVDTNLYSPNGEFDVVGIETFPNTFGDEDSGQTLKKIVFRFTFRRKWQFYGQNLLMPIVLNSVLMTVVFLLPIESGEKMGYCLTVLLSYIVFLTWVTENLPPVSTDTSILQVYLAVVLCLGCLATLLTTWILRLYHHPSDKPLSRFYVTLARRILIPLHHCLCFGRKRNQHVEENFQTKLTLSKISPGDSRPPSGNVRCRRPSDLGEVNFLGKDLPPEKVEEDSIEKTQTRDKKVGEATVSPPSLTWQELAALLDFFLFWVFAIMLMTVTTVIFALLYANY